MEIVLLHVADCPNRLETRRNLDAALASVQLDAVVREREVLSDSDARRTGMNGSPTVLVDGVDLFDGEAQGTLACRLYREGDRLRGAPPVKAIIERIARVRSGQPSRASQSSTESSRSNSLDSHV